MNKDQLKILEGLEQFPPSGGRELHIGKNDPKNGGADYWWCSYGDIHLEGYYSLPAMLADLANECVKIGYAKAQENALII